MEKSSLNKSLKIFFICYSIMTEIRKDAKFLRVETLGLNAGNVIIDNKGNVAIGIDALKESSSYLSTNTSIVPKKTVCIGYGAGKTISGTTPSSNGTVAIGYQALNSITSGDENTAVGYHSGLKLDTGDNNTIFGWEAMGGTSAISADDNTCIGHRSGYGITSGDDNVFVGTSSGDRITTGNDNICIGSGADTSVNSGTNQIVIGKGAVGQANNKCVIGNSSLTHVNPGNNGTIELGETSMRWEKLWAANSSDISSDRRLKKNIQITDLGLDFIKQLNPVSYQMIEDDKHYTHYGIIAQDVLDTLSNFDKNTKTFAGISYDEKHDIYGAAYTEFISPLIKAVQELSAQVEVLKTKIAELSS